VNLKFRARCSAPPGPGETAADHLGICWQCGKPAIWQKHTLRCPLFDPRRRRWVGLSGRPSFFNRPASGKQNLCAPWAVTVRGAALPRDRRSRAARRRGKAPSIASTIEDPPFDDRKPADTRFPCSVERLPIRGIESARRPPCGARPSFGPPSRTIHKRLRRFP
jgi:hypothetical protein